MRPPTFLLFAGLGLVSITLPAAAQKFLPKTIQFKGAPEYSEQELLAAASLKKGIVLTSAEMSDHSKLLMDSGVFDGLTYKFDGQDLVYQLSISPLLYAAKLENLPLTPGSDLDAKIRARLPLYHGKVPAEGTLLRGVIDFLQQSLDEEGIHATVTATPSGVANSRKVTSMSFSIASPQVRVGAIQLEGVSATMQATIKRAAEHLAGLPYDTASTASDLERAITSSYVDEGYAAVKVKALRTGAPQVSANTADIPFSIAVEEGHIYKLGTVLLPPGALLTQAEIDKARAFQPMAPSKGVAIRSIWLTISSRYKSKGYLDCAVIPHPQFDEAAGVVNYAVAIDAGPVYHLALLKFENVSDDLRKLLMRNWQMLPGDPFDELYVANFVLSAQKADPVLQRTLTGVKYTYEIQADPETHDVNCILRFERAH